MTSLKGQTAVVTGSTSGIGLGLAEALAAAGAKVMLNGFGDPSEIEKTRAGLAEKHGVDVAFSGADMSKPADIRAMIADTDEALGPVDILVNNAGIQHVAPVEDFADEKWDAIIAINMSSNFHAIKAVLPGMKRRNHGRIVNVSSAHGLVASPFKTAYVAAKHGVVGLTKAVALEVAETGITCNAICPGFVKTPLVEGQIDAQAAVHGAMDRDQVVRDVILASQPSKRFVEIADVAAMCVFLCSSTALGITGTALSVDGGWTAR